jgi:protein transport protein SEC61 subunit gamma and related proteins
MSILRKWGSFYKECVRVLKVTKKPNNVEFQTITKVTGLGMLIIGFIGFLISLIFMYFKII